MRVVLVCALLGCSAGRQPPASAEADVAECVTRPIAQPLGVIAGRSGADLLALTAESEFQSRLVESADEFATQSELAMPVPFASIDRSPAGILFACASDFGGVYRSLDAGQTWSPVTTSGYAHRVFAFNDRVVYALGFGKLSASYDDGDEWSPIDVGESFTVNAVQAFGKEIFVAGSLKVDAVHHAGAVAYSPDGAHRWSIQVVDGTGSEAAIWGTSAEDVYVVGTGAHHSTDHGATWTPLAVPGGGFRDVGGSSSRVRVTSSTSVFISDDGGATWSRECDLGASAGRLWTDVSGGAMLPLSVAAIAILP